MSRTPTNPHRRIYDCFRHLDDTKTLINALYKEARELDTRYSQLQKSHQELQQVYLRIQQILGTRSIEDTEKTIVLLVEDHPLKPEPKEPKK